MLLSDERIKSIPPKRRAVVCGAYGMGNLGDEAMCEAVSRALLGHGFEVSVITRQAASRTFEPGVKAIDFFDLVSTFLALKSADTLIMGGGSLIQNVTSRRSLYYYLGIMRLAKRLGCEVKMFACGIGPVSGERDIRRTSEVLNSCTDEISVRDEKSLEALRAMGVTKPHVLLAADAALTLSPDTEGADRLLTDIGSTENCIAFCVREWQNEGLPAVASAVRAAKEWGYTPIYVLLDSKDKTLTERLAELEPAKIISPDAPRLAMGIIAKMRLVVSMRLHGLVFAAAQAVPAVGIAYDPKVSGFAEYSGYIDCLELKELCGDELIRLMKKQLETDADTRKKQTEMLIALAVDNAVKLANAKEAE